MSQSPRAPRIKPPITPRQTPQVSFGQRPEAVNAPRAKIIGSWTVGNSSPVESDRRVGQGIKESGWFGFVGGTVQHAIDNGFTRFATHNPFGTKANEQMLASQYLHAKAAELHWLTDGFVEAWRPITERYEVIAYQGSIMEDPSFFEEWKAGPAAFGAYVARCYQPIIEAGMVPAFDAHQHLPAGHFAVAGHRFVMQSTGPVAYFEPGPAVGDAHWFKSGMRVWIANDNSSIVQNRAEPWQLNPLPSGTEIVLQLTMAPGDIIANPKYNAPQAYIDLWDGCTWENYPSWIKRFVGYHHAKGRTVCVNPRDFERCGLTVGGVI